MKDTIRVLSFDPGTSLMGYAVEDYHLKTGKVVVIKHGLLKGDQIIKDRKKDMLPYFSKQYTVLDAIRDAVTSLIDEHKPNYVASENAFSYRFVTAFAALLLTIDRIRQACHNTLHRDVYLLQPKEVKQAMADNGAATKDDMKTAVLKCENLTFRKSIAKSIDTASEHEFDAIGVGYAFTQRILPGILAAELTPKEPSDNKDEVVKKK